MDLLNRFKSFLGLSNGNGSNQNSYPNSETPSAPSTKVRDDIIRDVPNEQYTDDYGRFGFNVFSNPLEMHRYFEHQMNEIMKSFGMFGGDGSAFGNHGDSFSGDQVDPFFGDNPYGNSSIETFQFPAIEEFQNQDDQQSGSLREQYLKPGYENAISHGDNKVDKDVDGKVDIGDLNSILRGRPSQVQPHSFFFGQSMSTKIIQNADGTIETHKTIKDQYGNEEVTITRKQGDKEYSVTTRTDKDGCQEVIENLVNIDEKDKNSFLGTNSSNRSLTHDDEKLPHNWFPFENLFK